MTTWLVIGGVTVLCAIATYLGLTGGKSGA